MIELHNRWITNSGITIVEPESDLVATAIKSNNTSQLRVTEITPAIAQFNQFSKSEINLPTSIDFASITRATINIPTEFSELDLEIFIAKLVDKDSKTKSDKAVRATRAADEYQWFSDNGKLELIKTLVYIIATLRKNSVAWGIGRGSSVNSYLLYLIGVHGIDPIEYELDWREFMRTQ